MTLPYTILLIILNNVKESLEFLLPGIVDRILFDKANKLCSVRGKRDSFILSNRLLCFYITSGDKLTKRTELYN